MSASRQREARIVSKGNIVDDLLIADEIISIVSEEVEKIKQSPRDVQDLLKLEKLSKIYTAVMACNRENIKSGLLGQLRSEDLESEEPFDRGGDADDTDE